MRGYTKIIGVFQFFLLIGYAYFALTGNQNVSNILSPLLLFGVVVIIHMDGKSRHETKQSWQFLEYLVLSWAIVDSMWFIDYNLLGGDPESNSAYTLLYLFPNLILVYSSCLYIYKNIKKWHFIQVVTDFVLIALVLYLSIRFSLVRTIQMGNLDTFDFVLTLIYVITDIIILAANGAIIVISRKDKFNFPITLLLLGVVLFPVADLMYSYAAYYGSYVANDFSDVLFMISMSLFGYSSILQGLKASETSYYVTVNHDKKSDKVTAFRKHKHLKWILLLPITLFIFGLVDVFVILKSLVLFGLHGFVSQYFEKIRKIEELLSREKLQNEYLEHRVAERTRELKQSN